MASRWVSGAVTEEVGASLGDGAAVDSGTIRVNGELGEGEPAGSAVPPAQAAREVVTATRAIRVTAFMHRAYSSKSIDQLPVESCVVSATQ